MQPEEMQILIDKNYTIKQLALHFDKAPGSIKYWLSKFSLKTKQLASKYKYAHLSEIEQIANRKKLDVEQVARRRKKVREKAIEYKGGKCEFCGYSSCNAALEFHHIDATTKKFELSISNMGTAWSTLKLEIDKCLLLCANCHREEHFRLNMLE